MPTESYRPSGTGVFIDIFQAFHAWLPSLNPFGTHRLLPQSFSTDRPVGRHREALTRRRMSCLWVSISGHKKNFQRVLPRWGVQPDVKDDLSDSELQKKLQAWRVEIGATDDFQREVWSRIAAREAVDGGPAWLTWVKRLLSSETLFSTPRLALAAVTISLLVGAGTGLVETGRSNTAVWKHLENQYVQSINPYWQVAKL